jgi:hypothetical protein
VALGASTLTSWMSPKPVFRSPPGPGGSGVVSTKGTVNRVMSLKSRAHAKRSRPKNSRLTGMKGWKTPV